MPLWRDIHARGPVSEGKFPEHRLLRDAIELQACLQTIPSVQKGVWVSGMEPDQAGWHQSTLTLRNENTTAKILKPFMSGFNY